jgi:hypothetical protein
MQKASFAPWSLEAEKALLEGGENNALDDYCNTRRALVAGVAWWHWRQLDPFVAGHCSGRAHFPTDHWSKGCGLIGRAPRASASGCSIGSRSLTRVVLYQRL